MAELILFTGTYDPDYLEKAAAAAEKRSGASQPAPKVSAGGGQERQRLKNKAKHARNKFRKAQNLVQRLKAGQMDKHQISHRDWHHLDRLQDGSLLRERNEAVLAHGHGFLLSEDGRELAIGGSTGGFTREFLDGYQQPNVVAFMHGH